MSFVYDPNKLAERGKDRLRFELGDTIEADAMLHDEELTILLSEQPTFKKAKAQAAEIILATFTREPSYKVGPLSYNLAERAELWAKRAKEWREEADNEVSSPLGSEATADAGTATGQPYFTLGMHDNT